MAQSITSNFLGIDYSNVPAFRGLLADATLTSAQTTSLQAWNVGADVAEQGWVQIRLKTVGGAGTATLLLAAADDAAFTTNKEFVASWPTVTGTTAQHFAARWLRLGGGQFFRPELASVSGVPTYTLDAELITVPHIT